MKVNCIWSMNEQMSDPGSGVPLLYFSTTYPIVSKYNEHNKWDKKHRYENLVVKKYLDDKSIQTLI